MMKSEIKKVMGIPIDELFDTAFSPAQFSMGNGISNFKEVINKLLEELFSYRGKENIYDVNCKLNNKDLFYFGKKFIFYYVISIAILKL